MEAIAAARGMPVERLLEKLEPTVTAAESATPVDSEVLIVVVSLSAVANKMAVVSGFVALTGAVTLAASAMPVFRLEVSPAPQVTLAANTMAVEVSVEFSTDTSVTDAAN